MDPNQNLKQLQEPDWKRVKPVQNAESSWWSTIFGSPTAEREKIGQGITRGMDKNKAKGLADYFSR